MKTKEELRAENNAWHRRKRQRLLAEKRKGATVCPRRFGPAECGGLLVDEVLPGGRVIVRCPRCDLFAARRCVDCRKPIEADRPHARRCLPCKKISIRASDRAGYRRHRMERLAKDRQHAQRPHVKARKRELRKRWREANPRKVMMYKRRARLSGTGGYATREKLEAYQKEYRARNRERRRAAAMAKYYERRPNRPQPVCRSCGGEIVYTPPGRPPVQCDACVLPCLRARRRRPVVTRQAEQQVAA